jgi:hypothetical protein
MRTALRAAAVAGGAVLLSVVALGSLGGARAVPSTGSSQAGVTIAGGAAPVAGTQSVVGWCTEGESLVHGGWTVEWADSVDTSDPDLPAAAEVVHLSSSRPTSEDTEHGQREGWLVDYQVGDLQGQHVSVAVVVTCER